MNTARRNALIALTTACLLWGTSVPLSKTALGAFGPVWLTSIRFAAAGLILMLVLRPRIRGNVRPALMLWGALGYGGCVAIQNIGLQLTSVTHAALLLGAVPVIVAGLAVLFEGARVTTKAWAGFALSLVGIVVVAGAGGGDASLVGDALVFVSVLVGAGFTLIQARMLPGQDVVAVSAAQFLASAVVIAPIAALTEGLPAPSATGWSTSALIATAALAVIGTVLPYTLFAYGQAGVEAQVAGAFLNLETLVAACIGVVVFGEPMGIAQGAGAFALLGGIYLSTERSTEPALALEPAPVALESGLPPVLALTAARQFESVPAYYDQPEFERAA